MNFLTCFTNEIIDIITPIMSHFAINGVGKQTNCMPFAGFDGLELKKVLYCGDNEIIGSVSQIIPHFDPR